MNSKARILNVLEPLIIVVALAYVARWIYNPTGTFEPIIAGCTTLLLGIDFLRRNLKSAPAVDSVQPVKVDSAQNTATIPQVPASNDPAFNFASESAFFAQRFAAAFPGVRTSSWFYGKDAVKRLAILLKQPLRFASSGGGTVTPIWWFRDGNNSIEQLTILSPNSVLLNYKELKINRICAVYSSNYKKLFVYIEVDPSQPTGLYPRTAEEFRKALEDFGYVWEEYGLFKGTHLITRSQFDDNSALILGEVVPLNEECEIRARYISRYNFIICAHDSPINNHHFDKTLEKYMNRLLNNDDCVEELSEQIEKLPSR